MSEFREPQVVGVNEVNAAAKPTWKPTDEAKHKASVVIDMISVTQAEWEKLSKFYKSAWFYIGAAGLAGLVAGLIIGSMSGGQGLPQ